MNTIILKGARHELRMGPSTTISEKMIFVPMTPWQKALYEILRKTRLERFAGINDRAGLPNKIRMLYKVSTHPEFVEAEDIENKNAIKHAWVTYSGKFELLDRIIMKLKVRHHKTVILCQTPDTLSGVCETLKLYKPYGVTFSKIGFWDGHKHQSDAIQKFHYETDFLVMITHVLANDGINQGMSKGNNLWIADTVIFFEGTWDVGTDERALHQIIKMGNVCGHVRVMRFVTLCKIEEMMVDAKNIAKIAVISDSSPKKYGADEFSIFLRTWR